jgi:hypothetical protein
MTNARTLMLVAAVLFLANVIGICVVACQMPLR